MATISKVLQHFGFSVRELAEVLNLSHSQMLNIERNRRTAPAHLIQTLSHPLFTEVDAAFTPEPEKNTIETGWLHAQLAVARGRLLPEQTKWATFQKKRDGVHRIIHHTHQLDESTVLENDFITRWWLLQRSKAELWLQLRKPHTEWEQKRKLHLLEAEVDWLQKRISGE